LQTVPDMGDINQPHALFDEATHPVVSRSPPRAYRSGLSPKINATHLNRRS
jgi:hypothetical protein